jgi:hypothetical protein
MNEEIKTGSYPWGDTEEGYEMRKKQEAIKMLRRLREHVELEMCSPICDMFGYIDSLDMAIEALGGDPDEEEEEEEEEEEK